MDKVIELSKVYSGYGAIGVLHDVSLDIPVGQVTALLGRNGMGKTTLIKTLMGMVPLTSGSINLDGQAIGKLPPHRRSQMGLGLVPEGRRIFSPLTVSENLLVAESKHSKSTKLEPWTLDRLYSLFPRLKERATQTAGTLSGGEQQMLAIARALITQPRYLILDEATEGLAPQIRTDIWNTLRELKNTGLGILLVDSRLHEVLKLSDRVFLMQKGQIAWSGRPETLKADQALQTQLLGI